MNKDIVWRYAGEAFHKWNTVVAAGIFSSYSVGRHPSHQLNGPEAQRGRFQDTLDAPFSCNVQCESGFNEVAKVMPRFCITAVPVSQRSISWNVMGYGSEDDRIVVIGA